MAFDAELITVPDIEYAANYFPQIYAAIRRRNRTRVPEITNEDDRELFLQCEAAFAAMAHYNNVLLDLVANSMFLPTSKIPESVKMTLQLFGSDLYPANPSQVDMLATLAARYAAPARLLEAYRKFATKRTPDYPEIVFENVRAYDLTARTDDQALTYAYGLNPSSSGGGATCTLSSIEPDIVTDSAAPFVAADVGRYMVIKSSTIGNDIDLRRILEVSDLVGATYRKARLENASFLTEAGVATWIIYDLTVNLAGDWSTGVPNDPFSGAMDQGCMIFIGHPDILWDRVDVTLTAGAAGYKSIWEFYDPYENTTHPDSVATGVGTMTFVLTSLLGSVDVTNALVEVEYIPTGAKFRRFSDYAAGANRIVISSYLGQTTPSTSVTDYVVRCAWRPVPDMVDATLVGQSSWAQDGKFEFTCPRTQDDSWYKYRLFDSSLGTETLAFFLRLRIIDAGGVPTRVPQLVRIDRGSEYIVARLVQGQTVEETGFSSNGEVNQLIHLTRKPYIYGSSRVFVTEGSIEYEWTVLTSFLRSRSVSRHCVIDPQPDGTAFLKFGDGTAGKIPAIGANNIRVVHRIGAEESGDIGAGTLTVNRDGVGTFRAITNPRQGRYWIAADWSSQIALESAKTREPELFQTLQRSTAPQDTVSLALAFRTIAGVRVVYRAKSYEESFGPKTTELVVVGGGGAALGEDEKTELQEYFNGGNTYGYDGVHLCNSRVVVTNYIPKMIALDVRVECYPVITEALVRSLLSYILSPTAIESNGKTFMWRFGQSVALSRIASEIFKMSPGNIFDVDITSPTVDFDLVARELPVFDAAGSNVTIISPRFED